MKQTEQYNDDFDSPWKGILDKYFQDFMELFFSDAAAQIDWSKGYENLDKEFQKIVRDARIGKRLADKLVKVWLKSGDELVVYVHTEVQGAPEADFERRMYTYHYRIFDRYDGHVVSLAVLSDEGDKWCPTRFETKMWGCRLQFDFSTVKLNDFRLQGAWSQLEESKNPFAKVVMAHLKTQDTKKDHDERKRSKMVLARSLYSGGFTKQQIMDIYLFMDWVMRLPDELAEQFDLELQEFEKERKMTYVTTMERRGIKKGMEQGMQQGMQREAQKTLLRILRKRFGEVTPAIEKMVADAPVEQIEAWIDAALDADALQQVFPDV